MLGNFTYHNPTKLIFGKDAMGALEGRLDALIETDDRRVIPETD